MSHEVLDSSVLGVGCWFVSTFVLIGMLTVFNDLSGQLLFLVVVLNTTGILLPCKSRKKSLYYHMAKRGRPPKDDVPWEDIKNAYMLGEPCGIICERYPGLKPGTLRSRASREGWTTPRNIKQKLAERVNEVKVAEMTGTLSPTQAKNQLSNLDSVVDTLAQRQSEHRDTIARITQKKFSKQKLPPIKSWRDADIADKMARRALDMDADTPDAVINVGVLGSGAVIDDFSSSPTLESHESEKNE